MEIKLFGDDVLREHCEPVEKFDTQLWRLLDEMYKTMVRADGIGLAAPQVGVLKRVVVIDTGERPGRIELINPVIISVRGSQKEAEGCLSYPGKRGVVERPAIVVVKAFNRYGRLKRYKGRDLLARAFCHEIDHLNGILYSDKVIEWLDGEEG